jgi:hypothetical protein
MLPVLLTHNDCQKSVCYKHFSFSMFLAPSQRIVTPICLSVRPQVTIPEPVNGILSDIVLGRFAKNIDIDSHQVETQLQ